MFLLAQKSILSLVIRIKTDLQKGDVKLVDFLQTPENCILKYDKGNGDCNEIIFSVLTCKDSKPVNKVQKIAKEVAIRQYTIGSKSLYVKIYARTRTCDKILTSIVRPFRDKLVANQIIDKWFFLRYADPEDHIRIRFHSFKANFRSDVLIQLNQLLQR